MIFVFFLRRRAPPSSTRTYTLLPSPTPSRLMVGACGALSVLATPVGRRIEVHPTPRGAGDGPHDPHEGHGPIHESGALEARAEIENLDRGAVIIRKAGDQDGRIAEIPLLRLHLVFDRNAPLAARDRAFALGLHERAA